MPPEHVNQYEQLKNRRSELSTLLNRNRDMKQHGTYKAVERELKKVRQQIKTLFHK